MLGWRRRVCRTGCWDGGAGLEDEDAGMERHGCRAGVAGHWDGGAGLEEQGAGVEEQGAGVEDRLSEQSKDLLHESSPV